MKVIAIEGPDGIGKSTISKMLVGRLDEEYPKKKVIHAELPSRQITGMAIKSVRALPDVDPKVMALLYAADHLHIWNQLTEYDDTNVILVVERCFVSSFIYQGLIGKVSIDWLININKYNKLKLDIVFILRTNDHPGLLRKLRYKEFDSFEIASVIKKQVAYYNAFEADYGGYFDKTTFLYIDVDEMGNEEIVEEMVQNVAEF